MLFPFFFPAYFYDLLVCSLCSYIFSVHLCFQGFLFFFQMYLVRLLLVAIKYEDKTLPLNAGTS